MSESRTIVVTIIGTGVALGALLIGLVMNQTAGFSPSRSSESGHSRNVGIRRHNHLYDGTTIGDRGPRFAQLGGPTH